MTDLEALGAIREDVGELRGEMRGVGTAIDRMTDAMADLAVSVSGSGTTCSARGVLHSQIAERLERHSDTLRRIHDSQGNLMALESTVARHGERIETIEEAQRRLDIRADVADGKRTALVAWGREAFMLAAKMGLGGVALGAMAAAVIRALQLLGG